MRKTATKDGLPRNAKLPEILFNEERMKYLDAVDSFEDLLFARLGMYSGLRLSEILSLTPKSIIFPERCVYVVGKGDKPRYTPVDPATSQILKCFIADRKLGMNDKLFNVTGRTMQNRVEAYAKKAGINRVRVTPHTFRHSCASMLLHRQVPVEVVREILGHSDLSTTMIYYHVTPNIVVRSYDSAIREGLF